MRTARAALAAATLMLGPALVLAREAPASGIGVLAPEPVAAARRWAAPDLSAPFGTVVGAPGQGVLAPEPLPEAPRWAPPELAVASAAAPGAGVVAPAAAARPGVAPPVVPPDVDAPDAPRTAALAAARRLVGRAKRLDCSGFVLAAWRAAGVTPRLAPARSRSESLYRATRRVERPRPGDLAFFHHTYDRNRDGRVNDPFSHVALVEAVDGESVTLLHRGARGVERVRMDLARPSDPARNDPVRFLRPGERRRPRVLAGELFAGFGALPPAGTGVAAR